MREQRAFERKSINLEARFFYGNSLPSCTIKNISEGGMCIVSDICHFLNSRIEVFIPLEKKVMSVPVKIIRMEEEDDYNVLGVEVLNPTGKYLEFVDSL